MHPQKAIGEKMPQGFVKDTSASIKKAEDDLEKALEQERPDELGAKLPKEEEEKKKEDPKGFKKDSGTEDDVPAVLDGHNWKERYANLQRLLQNKMKGWKAEREALESSMKALNIKVDELSKSAKPAELPQSVAEIEELKKENPGAYAAIVHIAKEIAEGLVEEKTKDLSSKFEDIKRSSERNAEQAAWIELQKRHPDLDLAALVDDEQFQVWLGGKSSRIQEIMADIKQDVDAVSDVLDLYKAAFPPKKAKKASGKDLGAEAVDVKGRPELPKSDRGYDFTESEIIEKDRTDRKWVEKNLEKIDEAARKGRILMDVSDRVGTARRLASEAA